MAIKGLEYLYLETHDWEASKAFWQSLGFALVDPDGRPVIVQDRG
ncbi:MAG: hypothetical protein AAFX85_16745 [Pseudomonadota bacterium]